MFRLRLFFLFTSVAAFLVICERVHSKSDADPSERVRAVVRDIIAADNRCDLEAVMTRYAEDAGGSRQMKIR
jgi:hypothetical protein